MSIIGDTRKRFYSKFVGANALGIDRLHKGTEAEVDFYIKLWRERDVFITELGVAAFTMEHMQIELEELRADKVAAGVSSMSLGEGE